MGGVQSSCQRFVRVSAYLLFSFNFSLAGERLPGPCSSCLVHTLVSHDRDTFDVNCRELVGLFCVAVESFTALRSMQA